MRDGIEIIRPKPLKPPKEYECRECGKRFTHYREPGIQGAHRITFCSDVCSLRFSRRAAKKQREYKKRNNGPYERFTHIQIAERDGWKCHICGKRVTRANWSIDHLIPVSKGGPEMRVNVALAHVDCNTARGVDRIPAQLLAFG